MPPQPKIGQNLAGTFQTEYPTPNVADTILTAYLANNIEDYIKQAYGTPPPEGTDPAKLLVKQTPVDWQLVARMYATDRGDQSWYNYSISYSSESKEHPIFVRDYVVRRANYTEATRGSVLAGLVNAKVAAGGTGYDQSTVGVELSGGTGSGGVITAIVSNGVVVQLVIVSEGNYTVAPTLTITGGTGATGTAYVQPASAVLVKEDLIRMQESPLDSLFVLVRRVYETLPGPSITSTRYDQASDALVTTTKTRKAYSTIVEGVAKVTVLGVVSVVITESDQITDYVGIETQTVMPQPDAHDEDTAIISEECLPFQFPGTLDVDLWIAQSGAIGYAPPFIRRVPHISKVFWVISDTRPALNLNGLITFSQQHGLLGANLGETVYDATTFGPYTFPGSSPNLTTYLADWVGGVPRSVLGSVRRDGGKFRWRVERIFVQFIVATPAAVT